MDYLDIYFCYSGITFFVSRLGLFAPLLLLSIYKTYNLKTQKKKKFKGYCYPLLIDLARGDTQLLEFEES